MKKPWHLFLLLSIALLFVAFMHRADRMYLHLFDTYYVITYGLVFGAAAIFFVLPWLLYQLLPPRLYPSNFSRLHIYGSVFASLLVIGLLVWESAQQSIVTTTNVEAYYRWQTFFRTGVMVGVLLFVLLQLLFVFHLLKGIISRRSSSGRL
ncbi:hypothetical protein [Chitinophaga sp. CB10]|uniref:hypothetical protein n=1 Tax=Chitinophaga sp. CB10 TaxID=1891659 RepID=UPI0025C0C842|nr:hypothetical protein [Chitinophaga sp. CB10]